MSMDIAHFAFGATLTSLVITFLIPTVWFPRTIILLGGGWAMLPDIHRISPVAHRSLRTFHDSRWADICWFHRSLDTLDPTDSELFAALLLGTFIVATMIGERRAYRAPKLIREVLTSSGPPE